MANFAHLVILSVVFQVAIGSYLDLGPPKFEEEIPIFGKQARSLCLSEHNAHRQKNGKPNLAFDSRLELAAQRHNDVMTSQNCFDHQCEGEDDLGTRVTKAGYRWRRVGENIAANQRDCNAVMESWINSPGHNANILGDFQHVGCARKECASGCDWNVYWTCVFGKQ